VMSLQGDMSIERMCQLAQVSRAGFYRSLQERLPVEEEMEVRSTIQQIVLEHRRRYGYRRVTAELRRRGMVVNHKRVFPTDARRQPAGGAAASFRSHD
jgi:putative transposase